MGNLKETNHFERLGVSEYLWAAPLMEILWLEGKKKDPKKKEFLFLKLQQHVTAGAPIPSVLPDGTPI